MQVSPKDCIDVSIDGIEFKLRHRTVKPQCEDCTDRVECLTKKKCIHQSLVYWTDIFVDNVQVGRLEHERLVTHHMTYYYRYTVYLGEIKIGTYAGKLTAKRAFAVAYFG